MMQALQTLFCILIFLRPIIIYWQKPFSVLEFGPYLPNVTRPHEYYKKIQIEILNLTIWWVWVGGFFQVTPSNFPLFVSFKGILSKFSYVKPNPYYRLFCELGVLCYLTYRNLWRCNCNDFKI